KDAPLDPRAYVSVVSHMFGGCNMGSDPATSVCDARGKVHGREGLYVADASAIPSSLGVNPQHTIMALSRMWAEQLLSLGVQIVMRQIADPAPVHPEQT